MLKKEFKRKDVERMRNLIKGKSGESSELQIGYSTKKENHKEGDIWEENNKKWTIKDGIKQTYTKLDEIKKEAILPLFCPSCKSLMKKRNDSKMYKIHKMCFDCVIEKEQLLKLEGKWEEYKKNIHNADIDGMITDYTSFMSAALKETNNSFITEAGDVEKWEGGVNEERAKEALKKGIEYLESKKIK